MQSRLAIAYTQMVRFSVPYTYGCTGITLFTLFHNPTDFRQKTVNQKGEKKSAILKEDRTQDLSVMVQRSTNYATAASSLDSLLLYLINVTNEISCI